MYFVVRDGRYHDMTNFTFRQFMEGLAPNDLPEPRPTMGDWKNHLSTLFPEVRLKTYLEMRGADGGPWRRLCRAAGASGSGCSTTRRRSTRRRSSIATGRRRSGRRCATPCRRRRSPRHSATRTVLDIASEVVGARARGAEAARRCRQRLARRDRPISARWRRRWRSAARRRRTCSGNTRRAGAARSSRSSRNRSTEAVTVTTAR